jgi:hypothetical protein
MVAKVAIVAEMAVIGLFLLFCITKQPPHYKAGFKSGLDTRSLFAIWSDLKYSSITLKPTIAFYVHQTCRPRCSGTPLETGPQRAC